MLSWPGCAHQGASFSVCRSNRPLIALGGGYGYAVATLTADGEAKTISYGSGMTETIDRNSRGPATAITVLLGTSTLLGLTNEFEALTNNGNLKSQTMAPLAMKQAYSYDDPKIGFLRFGRLESSGGEFPRRAGGNGEKQ